MKLKCLAIDDEPLALKQIVGYIGKTPFLELTGSYQSAIDAMEAVANHEIDLLFVDIEMPDLNGLDFVKSLNKKPMVIFTTAYSEYAIEGFKVEATDYLLKPISYTDFLKSANKAKENWELKNKEVKISEDDQYIFIKADYKIIRINILEIKYIEAMREYVRFHLMHQKPIMSLLSMKSLEEKLPKNIFMRVHRSFIVNLNRITTIERNRIIFDEEVYIPVSEQYKAEFQKYIDSNFL